VAAQDSRDVRLTDARAGGVSANESNDIDLPQLLGLDNGANQGHQIEFDSSFRRVSIAAILQEIAAAPYRRCILQGIIFPIPAALSFLAHWPFSFANTSRRALPL